MAIVILIAIGSWFAVLSRHVTVDRLEAGDCLFIPTSSADDPTSSRPIGAQPEVEQVLFGGGAEDASCTASHGHEVSLITRLGNGPLPPAPAYDPGTIRVGIQSECDQGFESFVGHPVSGSAYVTFAVVPSSDQFNAGQRLAICLVARADGQWMTTPARGSGG